MSEPLPLQSVIGFGGGIENGLIAHPDGRTLIYPLGSTIVLRDKFDSRAQEFLQGHSDKVLCVLRRRGQLGLEEDAVSVSHLSFAINQVVTNLATCIPRCRCLLSLYRRMVATWPQGRSPTWASQQISSSGT